MRVLEEVNMSQSPLTGQFNFYLDYQNSRIPTELLVSIPSNGSIQFLFNGSFHYEFLSTIRSQSPLTGQFNFYGFYSIVTQNDDTE